MIEEKILNQAKLNTGKLYKKLQQARLELQNKKLKKTGYNPFQKFNYFELGDFLPHVNKIFSDLQLADHINIYRDKAIAECLIIDTETGEQVAFYTPIQEQLAKQQDIGAVITYARRYAYNVVLNISENDILDAQNLQPQQPQQNKRMQATAQKSGLTPKNNDRQKILQMLNMNAEISQIQGWLAQNNINASKFEDLTDSQLNQVWNLFNQGGK